MKDQFDKKIKESLRKGTNYPPELKDDIWNKIEQGIAEEPKQIKQRITTIGRKKRWKKIIPIAASILVIFTLLTTEKGSALISQIKEMFVSEKIVTEELEGMEEESNVSLQEGRAGYVIYFDKEKYSMVEVDGKDRIIFNEELSDIYPEVYMEIEQVEHIHPTENAEETLKQVSEVYESINEIIEVAQPKESLMFYAIGGTGGLQWDDPVVRYYFFSNEKGGSFIVKQQFFLEATEGHGVRFDNMLKEFYLIENE